RGVITSWRAPFRGNTSHYGGRECRGTPSPTFRDKLILEVFPQAGWGAGGFGAYDLTAGCPSAEAEKLVELLLGVAELGGHPAGFGPSAGGGVEQHGLADGGEFGQ